MEGSRKHAGVSAKAERRDVRLGRAFEGDVRLAEKRERLAGVAAASRVPVVVQTIPRVVQKRRSAPRREDAARERVGVGASRNAESLARGGRPRRPSASARAAAAGGRRPPRARGSPPPRRVASRRPPPPAPPTRGARRGDTPRTTPGTRRRFFWFRFFRARAKRPRDAETRFGTERAIARRRHPEELEASSSRRVRAPPRARRARRVPPPG